jgi:stage V sporulation protein G
MDKTKKKFECIEVTSVKVKLICVGGKKGSVKALVDVVLNNQLILRGLRIMESPYVFYVGYPVDPFAKCGEFEYLFSPITYDLRRKIERAALDEFLRIIKEKRSDKNCHEIGE